MGKHQRNGVEWQDRLTTPSQRIGAHVQTQRKEGGTPGEGSPLDPLLRFNKHRGVPRSAERGPGLRPCTPPPLKRWTKLSNARGARSTHEMRPPVRGPRVGGRAVGSMPGAGVMASSPAGAAAAAIAGAAARSAFFIVSYFPERQHYRREDDQPHEQRRPVLSYPFKHLP